MAHMFGVENDPTRASTTIISEEVKKCWTKFKTAKNQENNAMILKIDPVALEVVVDEELQNVTVETLASNLPESQPRFLAYSYKMTHKDGRTSFPLCMIYYCPVGGPTNTNILYSSTKPMLLADFKVAKVFDLKDAEEFTEEWLREKLGFFG